MPPSTTKRTAPPLLTMLVIAGGRLRALPFIERAQGDTEVRVVFHVDHLAEVLAVLKPYRRRQVSAAERDRLGRWAPPTDSGLATAYRAS